MPPRPTRKAIPKPSRTTKPRTAVSSTTKPRAGATKSATAKGTTAKGTSVRGAAKSGAAKGTTSRVAKGTTAKGAAVKGGRESKAAAEAARSQDISAAKESSRRIALLAAQAGLEKKATGIEIIDVSTKVDYADFLVLMTGASDRNVAAIAQEVDASLAKQGIKAMALEGLPTASWVLIDFVDVVVHVFQRDVRSLYDLDGLWMDADRLSMGEPTSDDEY